MDKYVEIDHLIRDNRGRIIWKDNIGLTIKFKYDDVNGVVKILDYDSKTKKLKIHYNNEVSTINTQHFLDCKLGGILKKITKDFKIELGIYKLDERRSLDLKHRKYRDGIKYYEYKCGICGNEDCISEYVILGGGGCNACCNPPRKAVLGINTIWDTDRWMVDLGVSEEDAKRYTKASNEKITVTCPNCGNKKKKAANSIYRNKTIACSCSDKISYPEKFITNLLTQLNVKFQTQLSSSTFEWCEKYRYDFYLPDYNCIIETHGIQHYEEVKRGGVRTLAEEQENDRIKRELVLLNDIEYYIELDCRYSDLEWIKNSILNSKLNELFDLSKIDWLKCEEFALKNVAKVICDYWNNKEENETTVDLGNIFNLERKAIVRYLKKGVKLGWCNYDPKEELVKTALATNKLKRKPIEIFKDGQSLGIFESASELERQSESLFGIHLGQENICLVCNNKKEQYKGFTFKYV